MSEIAEVLSGTRKWACVQSDALAFLRSLPADSVDLIFTSPPYEEARDYLENGQNLHIALKTEPWVAWMVEAIRESVRVCKGLVAFVVEGQTHDFRYSCGPALLMADLCRAGFNLRKPAVYRRNGIPGSGGPDWLANCWEWVICVTRPGKLPWSENTACGHTPKWAPGGEMAHRLKSGQRVNQWGPVGGKRGGGGRKTNGEAKPSKMRANEEGYPSHESVVIGADALEGANLFGEAAATDAAGHKSLSMTSRGANGERKAAGGRKTKTTTRGYKDGDTTEGDYTPPAIANPGNVIDCRVGGGLMGSDLASDNEAPFPEKLSELFILSFAPPGGIVCDPFSGSGTVASVCKQNGRRFIGCDLRQSQVDLTHKRLGTVTPCFEAFA